MDVGKIRFCIVEAFFHGSVFEIPGEDIIMISPLVTGRSLMRRADDTF
jgi:hypothetical protein